MIERPALVVMFVTPPPEATPTAPPLLLVEPIVPTPVTWAMAELAPIVMAARTPHRAERARSWALREAIWFFMAVSPARGA
jgi:hypothetical protein